MEGELPEFWKIEKLTDDDYLVKIVRHTENCWLDELDVTGGSGKVWVLCHTNLDDKSTTYINVFADKATFCKYMRDANPLFRIKLKEPLCHRDNSNRAGPDAR